MGLLTFSAIGCAINDQMCEMVVGESGWGGRNRVPWSGSGQWVNSRGGRSSVCGPPCVCVVETNGVMLVDCSMAQDPNNLVHGFAVAPPPPPPPSNKEIVVRLVVMSSELPALKDDSFGNVSFTHVHVKYNHGLGHVSENAFRSSRPSLSVLDVRNNNLTHFPLSNLNDFQQLQFLSVDDNGIDQVPNGVSRLASLVHLSASNNRISSLEPMAFTSMPNLQFLDLHSNRLTSLPDQLGLLPALRSLVLWGNPITTVPQGSLRGLQSLEYVDLSYTDIKDLRTGSLTTPTTSPWFLSLQRTPVLEITGASFMNGTLPSWIDLRDTRIRSLDQSFFQSLLHHMADQNIVHTDWGKPQLWTHNEDLACDCSIKWLVTNTTLLHHVSGRCNDKNIKLRFLDPDYFNIFCF